MNESNSLVDTETRGSAKEHNSSLVPFFTLTFSTSWAIWAALLFLPSLREVSPVLLICVGAYAPTAWGVYFTYRRSGGAGLRHLFARLLRVRVPIAWLLAAIFLAPLCFTLSAALDRLFTGQWPGFSISYLTPQFVLWILALGGPLNEEFGWRGFALPRLLQRRSPLAASVVLGLLWAFWHAPLFFILGSTQSGISLANFVVGVVCVSIFMTAAHLSTRGSLLIAVLFHTSANVSLGMWHLAPSTPMLAHERWISFQILYLCAMLPWIVVAGVILIWERASWFVRPLK